MSEKTEEFLQHMLAFFPSTKDEYFESIVKYGELLETVVIEDIFMPRIIELLSTRNNEALLEQVFKYFEDVANCGEEYLINLFTITVLEILGNKKEILDTAMEYMGPQTKQLQIKADKGLGRIIF